MTNRYTYNKVRKESDTKREYLESTIYPKVKANDNDIYIITQETDRLDLLANKYYGNSKMWWIIATANNINDATFYIEPGTQIRIPSDTTKIINDLTRINR